MLIIKICKLNIQKIGDQNIFNSKVHFIYLFIFYNWQLPKK
jgi:hypothetical protein